MKRGYPSLYTSKRDAEAAARHYSEGEKYKLKVVKRVAYSLVRK